MRPEEYKTKSGTLILEFLKKNRDKSLSAKEILGHMERRGESANITTVYRRLEKLVVEKKAVARSSENGKLRLYQYVEEDAGCNEHIHFQCTKCRKVFHLDCASEKHFARHIQKEHGLKIDFSKTVLYGLCAKCGGR